MIFYKLLADLVFLIHILNVVFVVVGPWPAWRRPWVRWVHLADICWIAVLFTWGDYCPMTHLETALRWRYDPAAPYGTDFFIRLVEPWIDWDLTDGHVAAVMAVWALLCAGFYAVLWRRERLMPPGAVDPVPAARPHPSARGPL